MEKRTFQECDTAIDLAFDRRERFPDDLELDNLSMHVAYLQGIEESGWTQVEYEYRFNRTPPFEDDEPSIEETEYVE